MLVVALNQHKHTGEMPIAALPRARVLRGLSLIELMTAMVLLVLVLGVTMGVMIGAQDGVHRARVRAELAMQGDFFGRLFNQELRNAGVGVPPLTVNAPHVVAAFGTTAVTYFDTYVILATSSAIGVIGDFPRPDGQYNTLGLLHNRPGGNLQSIMWHTENNGSCAPGGTSTCNTSKTSLFFPGETGCDAASDVGDRTCPWGMRRVVGSERLQVIAGNGDWMTVAAPGTLNMASRTVDTETVLSFQLDSTYDLDASWANDTFGSLPTGTRGQGWVTSIDRVFYFLDGTDIKRVQCSGDPDPQHASWPNLSTNTLPSSPAFTPSGGVANSCTDAEVVLKNVASFSMSYFNRTVSTTTKSDMNRVDYQIKLRKALKGRNVEHDMVGSISFRAGN